MALGGISQVSFQGENKESPKTPKARKGFLPASMGGVAANVASSIPAGIIVLNRFDKINNLSSDKVEAIHSAYKTILKETGLADKGVEIIRVADKKVGLFEKLKISLTSQVNGKMDEMVKNGANAFYNPASKQILMPEKQLATCGFHEIGHAMNANLSKWGSRLQKMRLPAMLIPSLLITYCALTRNKKPDEKGKISTTDKINNFIRNNSGKLAFLATTPILLEEGMASIKGQRLAAKFLKDKNLVKAVKRNNSWAYLTYISIAVAAGLGAYTATKIKDKIQAKKEV